MTECEECEPGYMNGWTIFALIMAGLFFVGLIVVGIVFRVLYVKALGDIAVARGLQKSGGSPSSTNTSKT